MFFLFFNRKTAKKILKKKGGKKVFTKKGPTHDTSPEKGAAGRMAPKKKKPRTVGG
jgi:hypothetical protein